MGININRYVDITSTVGAGGVPPVRSLIGRLFTGNSKLPPQTFIEFTNATDVGTYFGTASEEYARALFYFTWVSKSNTTADAIQFARWATVAVAPMIYSIPNNAADLAALQAISAGSFGLTIGATSHVLTGIDFTGATSLSDVASELQTAIRLQSGAAFATATVVESNGGFIFTAGATGAAEISVQVAGGGTDITAEGLLGWFPGNTYSSNLSAIPPLFTNAIYAANAIWARGSAAETISAVLTASSAVSNNFGSFLFLNNLNVTLSQAIAAATWNQTQNVEYLYTVPVSAANAAAWSNDTTGLGLIGGCCLTLQTPSFTAVGTVASASNQVTGLLNNNRMTAGMLVSGTNIPTGTTILSINSTTFALTLSANATGSATETITFYPNEFPEQCPMMIEANTDYTADNSVQNYMFQNFDPFLTPSVVSDDLADVYDAQYVNYYGQTQTSGQVFNLYQRGLMLGPITSPPDMTTYVNELWLKDDMTAVLFTLLMRLKQLPANTQGQSLALLSIQGVINQALLNGVISAGKTLTTIQQGFITDTSGDANAWYQVQNSGYWVDVVIDAITNQAEYILIYSKDDVVRKIIGQDILI